MSDVTTELAMEASDKAMEIVRLKAENARLKAALDVVFEDAKEIAAQMCNARAENAKLRELVLTLAFCANDEADCDQCPMNGVRCDVVQQCFCDGAAETLRELGIEVDG